MASFKQYSQTSGDASEAFSIKSFASDEIKVRVDGTLKTAGTGTGSGSSHDYELQSYTVNGGTIAWVSGKIPATDAVIRIYRDTDVSTAKATYSAGSSVKAGDLNDNQIQALRSLEEQDDQLIQTYDIEDTAVTTAKIKDLNVTTAKIAADAITGAKIADDSIGAEHITANSVTNSEIATATILSGNIADGNISTGKIADNAVTTAKIADDAVGADQIATNSITATELADNAVDVNAIQSNAVTTAKIYDSHVTTAKIANDAITNAKIADNSIDSEHYVDGSIDTAHLADNSVTGAKLAAGTIVTSDLADSAVTTAKIAADAITGAKIADDAIDSEHIAAGAVDLEHMSANSVDSDQYVDGSIDNAHLANDSVSTGKIQNDAITNLLIADNAVEAASIAQNAVVTAKIADDAVTSAKIPDNAVTTAKIADAELTTLAGMQSGTASLLAGGTALTATLAEINSVVDGKAPQTTISDDDTKYPTSGAVVDYVAAQLAPLGGLEVIATDAAFPNTQPSAGVVISIADAGGLVVNSSGTSTTARTVGGTTVTINNINSQFNSTTVDAGVAMMVSSTGSGQIYNYHKATLKEADLLSLSGDINDFAERYRVAGSAPSSSLDEGDLWWDTATDKLKVYDGSSWDEVASSGDFYINTISSYSGTGGNSATFNGSAYRFVLSNPGSTAQQHVVSINGVIQKPNSGTSQPSEGFVIDGTSIIFSNAPASGSDYFILTLGTTVSIGTPSDNTVSTAKIQNLAVTTAKIAADAVDGTKIADDAVGSEHIEVLDAPLQFGDSVIARFGAGNDLEIYHSGGVNYIDSRNSSTIRIRQATGDVNANFITDGAVELYYDNSKKFETTSDGAKTLGDHFFAGTNTNVVWDKSADYFQFYDNAKAVFGTGNDLQIYHDGSNSFIKDTTNDIIIRSVDDVYIQPQDGELGVSVIGNGAVELYYDNSKKLETTNGGVSITGELNITTKVAYPDNVKAIFGDGDDLQIYHDGSDSYIDDAGTGDLCIRGSTIYLQKYTGENCAKFVADGAVELYHNNSKKFETNANGCLLRDDVKLTFGDDTDFQLYHLNGGYAYLRDFSGIFYLQTNNFTVTNNAGDETILQGLNNGAVSLYYDNSKKFETTASGVRVPDNAKLAAGNADDVYLCHNGSDGYISNDVGNFLIYGNGGQIYLRSVNTENSLVANVNGSVDLFYDGTKKFETYANGVTITGHAVITGNISMGDSQDIKVGNADDLRIFHDGSNSYVQDDGTGFLGIQGSEVRIRNTSGHPQIVCSDDVVELYYDNAKKCETISDGVHIDGDLRFDNNRVIKTNSSGNTLQIQGGATNQGGTIQFRGGNSDGDIRFFAQGADSTLVERMRIKSDGKLLFGTDQWGDTAGPGIKFHPGSTIPYMTITSNSSTSAHSNYHLYNTNATNNGYRFYCRVDGGVGNYSSNNVNLCDEREKKAITDAPSQLSKVKAWKLRNFRYNEQQDSEPLKIGVIAQELETVNPELVNEDFKVRIDDDGNDVLRKGVKEEQMMMISIKALQELITKVETLETKVAALEAG